MLLEIPGADGGAVRGLPPSAAERRAAGFALGAAAVWGALTVTGGAFMRGDSAEEFCLPLLTAALALAYAEYGRRARPMRTKRLLLCGVLAGGDRDDQVYAARRDGRAVRRRRRAGAAGRRRPPRALKSAGVFLGGHGDSDSAVGDLFRGERRASATLYTAYIYNNVFLYGGEARDVGAEAGRAGARTFGKTRCGRSRPRWGMAALAADRGETARRPALRRGDGGRSVCGGVFVGRVWAYSLLALAPFGAIGCMQLHQRAEKNRLFASRRKRR